MSFMSFILNAVKDDRAYEEMLSAARQRLAGRDPMEIAARSAMPFDTLKGYFYWPSLGDTIRVGVSDWTVTGCRGNWHVLTVLHYLDMADGTALTGNMINFGQQLCVKAPTEITSTPLLAAAAKVVSSMPPEASTTAR